MCNFAKVILIIGVWANKIWGGGVDYFAQMFNQGALVNCFPGKHFFEIFTPFPAFSTTHLQQNSVVKYTKFTFTYKLTKYFSGNRLKTSICVDIGGGGQFSLAPPPHTHMVLLITKVLGSTCLKYTNC